MANTITSFFTGSSSSNPTKIITDRATSLNSTSTLSFPPDLPKYYTLLLEHSWTNIFTSGSLTGSPISIQRGYRLPLPSHIIDGMEVQYDHSYNWVGVAGNFLNQVTGGLAGAAATSLVGSLGYTVNDMKFVTLSGPQFKQYAFEWRMFPKSKDESDTIRDIYLGIKKGMAPSKEYAKLAFKFPNIFWLGFYPNAGYLFKFKPAVITSCQLDYQGGNPTPAFFSDNSAPEGIVMRLSFLELEYWHKDNFNNANDSSNPFDTADWYTQA